VQRCGSWLWWTYVVPGLGLVLTFFLSWVVFLPCVLVLLFFSLGKKMLGLAFLCASFLLVPLLKAFRYTPGIESGLNRLLRCPSLLLLTFILYFLSSS
jgi:hypothetical protein